MAIKRIRINDEIDSDDFIELSLSEESILITTGIESRDGGEAYSTQVKLSDFLNMLKLLGVK